MTHHKHSYLVLAFILLSLSLWGCATVERKGRVESLNHTVKAYGAMIRWREFSAAQSYLGVREGTPKTVDFDHLKNIRVTDYDVLHTSLNEEKDEATVAVSISYYNEYLNRVNTITQSQVWWYDEVGEGWLLDGELPDFR